MRRIVDAWMQHPSRAFLAEPMFESLRGLLFGIEPLDPWALGAAALLLAAAAILSLYGPARAAGRVEPATALRA